MDVVYLSRWQFGLTTVYHWLFVPLTLGLGLLVAFMQTRYYQTRDETWHKMTKFWGKLYLINFAIGVVTGIVQEFQFGMNWSEYSRFVGDIFGAPLAIEALLAFFLESTFLGVWIFGEGKIPEKVHLASIWLVAIGSILSSLFILVANAFMQAPPPGSFVYNEELGRMELTNFLLLIGNLKGWLFFWHTISDGILTAAVLILSISAYHLIRKQHIDVFKRSFEIATFVTIASSIMVFLGGHTMGQEMRELQPMKLAAIEAIWETEQPASFSLLTIGDLTGKREVWSIKIPYAMSFLACNNFSCEVQGVYDIQEQYEAKYGPDDYIPLMVVTYWTFRIMMGFGLILMGLGLFLYWRMQKKDWLNEKWMMWMPYALIMPYLANATGWIMTEMGRQPWIVTGYMKVKDAVSPNLTAVDLWISLIGYTAVYTGLAVAMFILMKKYATGSPEQAMHESVDVIPSFSGKK